jgi:hypothetical protein
VASGRPVRITTAGIWGSAEDSLFHNRLEGLKDKQRAGRPAQFPRNRSPRSRRWRANCRLPAGCRSRSSRGVGVDDLTLAAPGRDRAVADALVDLSAQPRLRGRRQPDARPLRQNLEGKRLRPDEYVISADEKNAKPMAGISHAVVAAVLVPETGERASDARARPGRRAGCHPHGLNTPHGRVGDRPCLPGQPDVNLHRV